jgi:di/tricarboxylate transporter
MWVAAVLVVATLVAMASGRVPPVLALGTCLAIAGILGIAPVSALFAGLSNGGVITVAGMLVIAKGVVRTGVIARVTWRLLSTVTTAGQALRRLIVPTGILSALINTTPIVAMLIPAARELQQSRQIPAREILLPIAHATTLAGSVTLIGTSSNLLIAGLATPAGVDVSMLSFAPVALPVALVGWVVILITAPRLLKGTVEVRQRTREWRAEIPVAAHANALGRLAADLGVERTQDYVLREIRRREQVLPATEPVEAGDVMVYDTTEDGVTALWGSPRFGTAPQKLYLVTAGSGAQGTLRDLEDEGDVEVIAAVTREPIRDTPVQPGETFFVTCETPEQLQEHEALTLWQETAGRAPQPRKTLTALAILVGVIIAASFGLLAVELAAFSGALLMVITGVLTPRSAVRALDWNVLFILAGSVGLGAIVVSSGLSDLIADLVRSASAGNVLMVAVVFTVTTAVLTNLTTNAAAASILTPVGIGIAADYGLNPVTVLALIGTCISFTLINPFSHQSNMMVMRPGGYTTAQFARFGVPLLLAVMVTAAGVSYLLLMT